MMAGGEDGCGSEAVVRQVDMLLRLLTTFALAGTLAAAGCAHAWDSAPDDGSREDADVERRDGGAEGEDDATEDLALPPDQEEDEASEAAADATAEDGTGEDAGDGGPEDAGEETASDDGGRCVTAGECDDGNPCTFDLCDSGLCAWAAASDGTPCPNGFFCDGTETCRSGACADRIPPCFVASDMCDELNDRCLCDDGLFCTDPDVRAPSGSCVGTPRNDAAGCSGCASPGNCGCCDGACQDIGVDSQCGCCGCVCSRPYRCVWDAGTGYGCSASP